jgi:signal transduction histidine kinase
MSHELRTPLNAIIGFSELLMDRILGSLNKEQADCVGDIHSSGERLTVMINDVLDLSRIEAGKLDIKLEPVGIEDLLKSVFGEMGQLLSSKSQVLHQDYPTAAMDFVSDQKLLHQVLINLVTNASKYSPPGSDITVSVKPDESFVKFSVEDHGVGLKPDLRDKVFEAFYQVGEPGYETQEGTGLGLSICYQNVKALDGNIWVDSVHGKGSTFSFIVPRIGINP